MAYDEVLLFTEKNQKKKFIILTLEMPKSSDEQAKASNISHYTTQHYKLENLYQQGGRRGGWVGK